MSKEKIYIFDTTLRDGAQTEGVDFSVEDKHKIAKVLSEIGVDYIEGGWPGANPVDTEFFSKSLKLNKSIFTAFGMTKRTAGFYEPMPQRTLPVPRHFCFPGKNPIGPKDEVLLEEFSHLARQLPGP